MTSITIRDVPDETRSELAARARRSGRSMQEYLKAHLMDLASSQDPEEFWRQLRARKQRLGATLSIVDIVEVKAADRR